jgi:hypothetical protein
MRHTGTQRRKARVRSADFAAGRWATPALYRTTRYGAFDRGGRTPKLLRRHRTAPAAQPSSAASTLSACVRGFTRRRAFRSVPSGPITNVERSMPM